jgi:hypothetical protein
VSFIGAGVVLAVVLIAAGVCALRFRHTRHPAEHPMPTPVPRMIPRHFPANTHLPPEPERNASGLIDPASFSPERDLVRLDNRRVWWESDHDGPGETEDDHLLHRRMVVPLRRLIELCRKQGAGLKIHDAYRDTGIHAPLSLHREGRALDVTSDDIPLEELAKLCWEAGFDWVFYESPRRGGAHVHCSVRRDHVQPSEIIREEPVSRQPAGSEF